MRLRCLDESRVGADGLVYDTIRMYRWGPRVATMRIGPITRRERADGC